LSQGIFLLSGRFYNAHEFAPPGMMSSEIHPFEPYVPSNSRILLLGSFPGREQTQNKIGEDDWFYGASRNQFWKILERVFQTQLFTKSDKQLLFSRQGIAITDLFLEINRSAASNGDEHLRVMQYNTLAISQILIQFPDIPEVISRKTTRQQSSFTIASLCQNGY
jgi:G:T/U-mismatch repair DNA glycosylase